MQTRRLFGWVALPLVLAACSNPVHAPAGMTAPDGGMITRQPDAATAQPLPSGRLLYQRDTGIFSANLDGSDERQLSPPGWFGPSSACWSPDGKRVAFAGDEVGEESIFTVAADGSDLRTVISPEYAARSQLGTVISDLSWSVGGQIAFTTSYDTGEPYPEIHSTFATDTDTESLVVDAARSPAWSPDGTQLAYVGGDLFATLGVIDAAGENRQFPLNGGGEYQGMSQPCWLPAGDKILFVLASAASPGDADLYSVRPNGSGLTQLTHLNQPLGAADVARDGNSVAFTTFGDTMSIELLRLDTGAVSPLIADAGWPRFQP